MSGRREFVVASMTAMIDAIRRDKSVEFRMSTLSAILAVDF